MNRREFGRAVACSGLAPLSSQLWAAAIERADVLEYVDPFIGTDGTGHVTPAAAYPFGMLMPGPDHADRGWSYASGYQWRATHTLGFSNTHISGAGIPELGDVLLMPAVGLHWDEQTRDFSAEHDKSSEQASPGMYRVSLPSHGVMVTCTVSPRVAIHRWRCLRDGNLQVLVDLQHGLHFDGADNQGVRIYLAEVEVDATRSQIYGAISAKNWVDRQYFFVVEFGRPIKRHRLLPKRDKQDRAPRFLVEFEGGKGSEIEVRVALSTVDVRGALHNLESVRQYSFSKVLARTRDSWQRILGRIQIQSSPTFKRIFYSALYRCFLHPSNISDEDGRVRGPRGEVIQTPSGVYDSTLSLWDTFRCVHPLHSMLLPERVPSQIESLVLHQQQMGFLPIWTVWGRESYCMIGNPAMPVISRAVEMGLISRHLSRQALESMIASATQPRPDAPEWAQRDWDLIDRFGYLPIDLYRGGESVSKVLEYGIGDDALARVAMAVGAKAEAERFRHRAGNWKRLYDPSTQVMRGRDSKGNWRSPFDPMQATSPMNNPGDYTEANAFQYTPTPALHDPLGFRDLLGGANALEAWLDRFFSTSMLFADKHLGQEAMIGLHAHGNEPSHHIPWLYSLTNRPDKGAELIRDIVRRFYTDQPDGILGNDDCGQMGAWLVWAALGRYPLQPGSKGLVQGVPLVKNVILQQSDSG